MQQKTVTITLEPDGTSRIDLEGFSDNTCARVADDFRGGDRVLREQKKPAFYSRAQRFERKQQQH